MRIVLDTNVVVSALLTGGGAADLAVQLVLQGEAILLADSRILAEYDEVTARPRFGFAEAERRVFLDVLAGADRAGGLATTPAGAARSRRPDVRGGRGRGWGRRDINPKLATGEIEVGVKTLEVFSKSDTPPFAIQDNVETNDSLRLKYRYLDLRRPRLQKNLMMRSQITRITRDYLGNNGFLEIETPFMVKYTPGGARNFLVPSRLNPGNFYALAESPQIFKQLLMVAGYERYFQIVRCFRDEDLRNERQPDFTQIDLEMSFVNEQILRIRHQINQVTRNYFDQNGFLELETPFMVKYTPGGARNFLGDPFGPGGADEKPPAPSA